jgi:hypothetical protein
MKTNFKLSILVLFIIPFLFTECKKEATTTNKSKTELLCSSKWVQKSFKVNPGIDIGGVILTDIYPQFELCDKDDTEKYETNGFGISDEGADKCDPSSPQTSSFTWSFKNNETILSLDGDDLAINTLNNNELIIETIVDGDLIGGIPGINYKITLEYKH